MKFEVNGGDVKLYIDKLLLFMLVVAVLNKSSEFVRTDRGDLNRVIENSIKIYSIKLIGCT